MSVCFKAFDLFILMDYSGTPFFELYGIAISPYSPIKYVGIYLLFIPASRSGFSLVPPSKTVRLPYRI